MESYLSTARDLSDYKYRMMRNFYTFFLFPVLALNLLAKRKLSWAVFTMIFLQCSLRCDLALLGSSVLNRFWYPNNCLFVGQCIWNWWWTWAFYDNYVKMKCWNAFLTTFVPHLKYDTTVWLTHLEVEGHHEVIIMLVIIHGWHQILPLLVKIVPVHCEAFIR